MNASDFKDIGPLDIMGPAYSCFEFGGNINTVRGDILDFVAVTLSIKRDRLIYSSIAPRRESIKHRNNDTSYGILLIQDGVFYVCFHTTTYNNRRFTIG